MRNSRDAHLTSRAEGTLRLRNDDCGMRNGRRCALGALGVVLLLSGCSMLHAPGFSAELSDAARQVSMSIADQAVWEDVLARLDGQIIEPGVLTYGGTIFVAGAKLTGASGQLKLEGEGAGSGGLSPEARAALVELAQRPDVLAELIGWLSASYPETTEMPEVQPELEPDRPTAE